jgi:hypothetical protein
MVMIRPGPGGRTVRDSVTAQVRALPVSKVRITVSFNGLALKTA